MSKEYIVTISEGEKTEKKIIENLELNFFKNRKVGKELIFLPFRTSIYALWNVMCKDDFETDIIEVLIENDPLIRNIMKDIDKKSISEVYLFFDYDGHAYNKIEEVDIIISEMIERFDNETDNGKIYISYPMVEAIKDLKKEDSCSRRCSVPAKENIRYKSLVAKDSEFKDLAALQLADWSLILSNNLRKANCIIFSEFIIPTYDKYKNNINQASIFQNQINKFINLDQSIAVLAGFPFFLIDYFGENLYNEIITNNCNDNRNEIKQSCCIRSKNINQ